MTNSTFQIVLFFVGFGIGLVCGLINLWLKIIEKSVKLCDFYKFINKFCVFFLGGAAWFILSMRINYGALSSIILIGETVGFIVFWVLFRPFVQIKENAKNAKPVTKSKKSA